MLTANQLVFLVPGGTLGHIGILLIVLLVSYFSYCNQCTSCQHSRRLCKGPRTRSQSDQLFKRSCLS